MTVLVTGGAGYIGSHAVRALEEQGDDVVVLDRVMGPNAAHSGSLHVVGDVNDEPFVRSLIAMHGVDAILHFAAHKSAPASLRDPGEYFGNNVAGSLTLLRAAAAGGVRSFVFSSSCAVYGTPPSLPITEEAPVRPENPYGESKALVERMLPWFEQAHGIRYASLRYFNAAGAHPAGDIGEDWTGAANLVPVVLRAAFTGEAVLVHGTDLPTPDGTGVRDYVHVVDLAAAHVAALSHLRRGGSRLVLNLGTGRGHSVREVIAAAGRITGRPIRVIEMPPRAGDPPAVWADPSLAAHELGWRAASSLDEMLETSWRYHLGAGSSGTRAAALSTRPADAPARAGHRRPEHDPALDPSMAGHRP